MNKKFYLCGIEVTKYRCQKKAVKTALKALDVKMKDWLSAVECNEKFCRTRRCLSELCEIGGELKFMYMSGIISSDEYQRISEALVGEDIEEVSVNDFERE